MLWQVEHGEHEATVREQMRINKMPAPKWIEEKPELKIGLEFYWRAFWELATCRQIAHGAEGPIPWTSMNEYATRFEIRGDEFDRFAMVIKAVDSKYLMSRGKKIGKINAAGQGTKPTGPVPRVTKERTPIGVSK